MSEVKRRRSGHGGHTRSNNSSRESLQEGSGGSTASSVDLRNGGRTKGNKSARGGKLRKSLSTNGIAQGLRGSNSIQVVVTSPQGGTTPQKSLSNSNTSVNGKEAELKNASKSTGKSGSAGTHPSQSKVSFYYNVCYSYAVTSVRANSRLLLQIIPNIWLNSQDIRKDFLNVKYVRATFHSKIFLR
ncbi:SCAPER [Bugula neritina]|uniref:SCAPER n=1 Tax=Bugula neritina TaxID=10212 RepID=A0A7J7KCG1_BUGNE|nr:SCAPER [Bugula neritina]